jgi:predicted lipid-binding transport protein (Tim44 family)
MKKFFIAMMVAISALSIAVSDAQAKRLGGGGSFGKQSPSFSRQAPSQSYSNSNQYSNPNQARPAPAPQQPVPPKPASPWRNMLGGALLGLGLGALLSHFGLGGALANMLGTLLMIALVVFAAGFIMRMFRRNSSNDQPQPAYTGYTEQPYSRTPEIGSRIQSAEPVVIDAEPVASNSISYAPQHIPADMDVPSFLRHAKTYFIRLQAAWDKADINDIREFTSTEMFAEIRMQLQERGASPNVTDVVSLDAELLGVDTVGSDYMASVKFSGLIREAENAPAEPFSEIWNLTKPQSGQGGWVLAGIQQLAHA